MIVFGNFFFLYLATSVTITVVVDFSLEHLEDGKLMWS